MPAKRVPAKFAIFAVDPGATTGVGWGVFRTDRGDNMLKPVMVRAKSKSQLATWEEKGQPHEQAWVIVQHWMNFRYRCNVEYGIPLPDIHFVLEDFQLRTKQADLTPVAVYHSILTLLYSMPLRELDTQPWPMGKPELQQPSTAKRITNARLREYDVWVVGSEHRRDVMRHIVQKVNAIL